MESYRRSNTSLMVTRVKAWISIGVQVRIFTARVGFEEDVCKLTGEAFTKEMMSKVIGGWTRQHIGKVLEATATKDFQHARAMG
jgi:hypothetical protein